VRFMFSLSLACIVLSVSLLHKLYFAVF